MISKSERFELRLEPEILSRIDNWREGEQDKPSRSEAVRRLVDVGLQQGALRPSSTSRLMIVMLCEILRKVGGSKQIPEIDSEFILDCIHEGHFWAIEDHYNGIFSAGDQERTLVVEISKILQMWELLELSFEKLTSEQKKRTLSGIDYPSEVVKFEGFDGNEEASARSIARYLVEKMEHFSKFRGRALNSHRPTLGEYRRMLRSFEQFRHKIGPRLLTASEAAVLLRAQKSLAEQ